MQLPKNYQTVMPYLVVKNAAAFIEFTTNVFGATENAAMKAMRDPNTIMHAEIMIGGSTIMFADDSENFAPQNAGLFVYVENADTTYEKAIAAGATVVTSLSDQNYGRTGGILDPFGNVWWITSLKKE